MTSKEIEEVVNKIRKHCGDNVCSTCDAARMNHGCVFLNGYPNEWVYIAGMNKKEKKSISSETALKYLKENLCATCAYGSQSMDTCDLRECDNRDFIEVLEKQLETCEEREQGNCPFYAS